MHAFHVFPALLSLTSIISTCSAQAVEANKPATDLAPLNYGAFTRTATYSTANQLGFFTASSLNVTYLQIPNSTAGYANLLAGQYDIITATIDNTVNFRFNSQKPFSVLGQLDQGPDLVIASVPSIKSVQDLKGKTLMVDNAVSGYAFLLRKILSLYGLVLNTDYTFDVSQTSPPSYGSTHLQQLPQIQGATNNRYQYLLNGATPNGGPAYATILTYPFTAQGLARNGINVLARASDFVNPFSSTAFTATTASIADPAKAAPLTRFLTAMLEANIYLADPKKRTCVIDAIATQLNITTDIAAAEYAAATDAQTGETTVMQGGKFDVSRQGLLNVIDVRAQFGGFAGAGSGFDFADAIVPGEGKLIDYSIRDKAVAAVTDVKIRGKC